ncbi:transporter substrate-binding domain-containing protein [Methylocella sp.]|uniref:transporter substrate-binding domain-containing protein n=1 Tax=Methylocella sp. TaxID=1978226 RepID=UPI003784FF05
MGSQNAGQRRRTRERPLPACHALRTLASGLFACAFLLSTAPAFAAQSELVIASEGARPPYNYLDAANELAGFEIDLGKLLCARMKVKCRFVAQDWESLIPGLLDRQYDAIMAALEINDETRKSVAFSKPYVRMPSAFLAQADAKGTDVSPAALKGRSIGVEAGGAHEAFLRDVYPESDIKPYATLEEAILDLGEGRVDFVIADKDAAADFLKTRNEGRCCKIVADSPHVPAYFGEGVAVGLRPGDKALKAMFDKALDEVEADGSFARLEAAWFGFKVN